MRGQSGDSWSGAPHAIDELVENAGPYLLVTLVLTTATTLGLDLYQRSRGRTRRTDVLLFVWLLLGVSWAGAAALAVV
ncbi:hypothetical protein [Rhodococcus sp. PvP104]|uniref:hypothetical protein n=1 Tax=Rhodococcus sp. PvP104 TaxID=2817911 RepID=UPI001AE61E20|nr:hypothetical protein [Rhodococcus sp. PvP104]MBP2527281.1 hypothetical protein [Rhodococcus sp. PvP104]